MPRISTPFQLSAARLRLARLRFTVWRSARMEGQADQSFTSIDPRNTDTVEIAPAAYQQVLSNYLIQHVRLTALVFNGVLMQARDRLKRRLHKRERLHEALQKAKRRAPVDGDAGVLGALLALALSIAVSIPLSWGAIERFEWSFMLSAVTCVGLSLMEAIIAHLAGRLHAALVLDEPDGPFSLTPKQRSSTKGTFAATLFLALVFTVVFAVLRSGQGGTMLLWLTAGLASLLIAAWSGYVSYPASRVLWLAHLQWRLARAERKASKAYGQLEKIVRHMAALVERTRNRLADLDHRGGITFSRSYRRHHPPESLPPTIPKPNFISEEAVLGHLLRPLGDLDLNAALQTDPQRGIDNRPTAPLQRLIALPELSVGSDPDDGLADDDERKVG